MPTIFIVYSSFKGVDFEVPGQLDLPGLYTYSMSLVDNASVTAGGPFTPDVFLLHVAGSITADVFVTADE